MDAQLSHNPSEINTQQSLPYEAILANIGDGLVVTDKKGIIISFNKAAETMLGWTKEEAVGKQLQDIVVIEYVNDKAYNKLLGNSEEQQATDTREQSLFFVRKDKSKFIAALKVTSYVVGEEVLGTITLFRDITAETNIDQMKTEFISLASHQLKTPLSTMRWYVTMLLEGDAGALATNQLKFVQNIKTATFRMIDLVTALLNISRIESGRIIVEPVPTDLTKIVTDVLEDVKPKLQKKEQTVNISHSENLPLISVDPRLIAQVFLNLLTNASKYSSEKDVISISLALKEQEVLVTVTDHGFGIPKNEHSKVFDKFYRGENIVTKIADGSGLGLYLVKAIIELSNGKIWFESQTPEEGEHHGTTFFFTLPITGAPAHKGVVMLDTGEDS